MDNAKLSTQGVIKGQKAVAFVLKKQEKLRLGGTVTIKNANMVVNMLLEEYADIEAKFPNILKDARK